MLYIKFTTLTIMPLFHNKIFDYNVYLQRVRLIHLLLIMSSFILGLPGKIENKNQKSKTILVETDIQLMSSQLWCFANSTDMNRTMLIILPVYYKAFSLSYKYHLLIIVMFQRIAYNIFSKVQQQLVMRQRYFLTIVKFMTERPVHISNPFFIT